MPHTIIAQSDQFSKGGKGQKLDPISFLRSEVESLRMIIRRVELQQATGIDVFTQVKELQMKSASNLEQITIEQSDRKKEMESMRKEFSSRMDSLFNKLDTLSQELQILQLSFKATQQDIQDVQASNICFKIFLHSAM